MCEKKRAPQIILGIDPGTRVTGYGLVSLEGRRESALDFGCIKPPPKAPLSTRYLIIFEGLTEIIARYKPDAVSIETQFVHKNPNSALKLGMARGMAILAATRAGIPVYEYTPKKAKSAIVGSGSASKEQVQKMIQMLLKLQELPTPEDAADALALALCHGHISNQLKGSPI